MKKMRAGWCIFARNMEPMLTYFVYDVNNGERRCKSQFVKKNKDVDGPQLWGHFEDYGYTCRPVSVTVIDREAK